MASNEKLKLELINTILRLKEEEIEAKDLGNSEMASGITLARVLLEEAFRSASGDIPQTINQN